MSTTRAIASNTIIQIIGKGASTFLGLVAVAIMTRTLGAEQFGWYSTAIGFLQFSAVLCDFGYILNTGKLLSQPGVDQTRLFNNLFTWRLIMAFVFQGSAAALIWIFPYPAPVKIAAAVLAFSFIPNLLAHPYVGYFQTKLKMMVVMIGEVAGRAFLVLAMWGLVSYHYGFLPMTVAVSLSAWVYFFYLFFTGTPVRLQINRAETQAIFTTMWPVALGIIINAFYLYGDRVLLPLYETQSAVGFYGAAYRVLDILAQVAFLTMGIMLPLLTYAWSRNLRAEFNHYYHLSYDLMLLVVLPLTAGTIALAVPLMRLVAGPEFTAAGQLLAWLALSSTGVAFGMTAGQIALAINYQRQALWIYGVDAVLSVIAYFYFIPRYGVYGAAGVTVASEFFAGAALLILTARATKLWPSFATAVKISSAALIMGLTVYRAQPLNIFLSILLGAIIYAGLILLLKVTSLDAIKNILQPSPQLPNNQ